MKTPYYYCILFLFSTISIGTITSCSSSDSENQNNELNILVLDFNSKDPIEGALIEVCNNHLFCTNILASGNTNSSGKITLSLSESDMSIAESFTIYKDNYMNKTLFLENLDLSKEIVVNMTTF